MTAKANSFGQRTFDFIEGLDRLDTPEAVLDTMLRVVSRFGFEWLAFTGILPKPGETLDDLILAHHSPDGLHDLYANRDYVRIDPNMRRALRSSSPFDWTWEDYGDEYGPRSTEVMRVLAEHTMERGFFVQCTAPAVTKPPWRWPALMWISRQTQSPAFTSSRSTPSSGCASCSGGSRKSSRRSRRANVRS